MEDTRVFIVADHPHLFFFFSVTFDINFLVMFFHVLKLMLFYVVNSFKYITIYSLVYSFFKIFVSFNIFKKYIEFFSSRERVCPSCSLPLCLSLKPHVFFSAPHLVINCFYATNLQIQGKLIKEEKQS